MKPGRDVMRFPGRKVCARIVPHLSGREMLHPSEIVSDNSRFFFDAIDRRTGQRKPVLGLFLRILLSRYYERPELVMTTMRADPTFAVQIPNWIYSAPRAQTKPGAA